MPGRSKRQRAKSRHQTAGPSRGEKTVKKKKSRRERERDKQEDTQAQPQTVSPLLYDRQVVLEELLIRHPETPEEGEETLDIIRAQLYERETARVKNQPVKARMCLSKTICRFELPMDLRELETLSPQAYLRKFSLVCKRRRVYYIRFFEKFDKDRNGLLSLKEMELALRDMYMGDMTNAQFQRLMVLCEANTQSEFDSVLFCAVCALSERLLYSDFVTEDTEESGNGEKERLEEADFCSLLAKLCSCDVPLALTRLLTLL